MYYALNMYSYWGEHWTTRMTMETKPMPLTKLHSSEDEIY